MFLLVRSAGACYWAAPSAAWSIEPPPSPSSPPLVVAGYSGCIHTGPTQRAQHNQSQGPGSLLMQGAEQQKAETTHLERELLGDHIYAHIYWVYTEPQPVLVQDKATKECVIIPSSRTGGWWLIVCWPGRGWSCDE